VQSFKYGKYYTPEQDGFSLENRFKLAMEVADSMRDATVPGFPIEFRMSAGEYIKGGYGIKEAIQFAKLIENKIDLLHVSTGSHENSFSRTHPTMFME
jgi:2,4-dienoyl-CoA reductase-like NADH-dependent reductase (Old Yellow Enzyme family)